MLCDRQADIIRLQQLHPRATVEQLAELAKVSGRTVMRALKPIREAAKRVDNLVEEYRGQVLKDAPLVTRSSRIASLIAQNDHPMTALKAIQYADHVNGIAPASQASESGGSAPLFNLPDGAEVTVSVGRKRNI